MNHLSEEQLNEYLDHASVEKEAIELHLSTCTECSARLNRFQSLFHELDSLPETQLSQDFTARVVRRVRGSSVLPKWLTLTIALQFVLALVASAIALPFVSEVVSMPTPVLQLPSLSEIFVQLQIEWIHWIDTFSTLQLPRMPEIPITEISSLMLAFALLIVSVLWFVGNGLLLRNQVK